MAHTHRDLPSLDALVVHDSAYAVGDCCFRALALCYTDEAVESCVPLIARFESGRSHEIPVAVLRCLPRLADMATFVRPVHAVVLHVDQCAVVGFERCADIQPRDPVWASERPVAPACPDLALEPGSLEAAAGNYGEDSSAEWAVTCVPHRLLHTRKRAPPVPGYRIR